MYTRHSLVLRSNITEARHLAIRQRYTTKQSRSTKELLPNITLRCGVIGTSMSIFLTPTKFPSIPSPLRCLLMLKHFPQLPQEEHPPVSGDATPYTKNDVSLGTNRIAGAILLLECLLSSISGHIVTSILLEEGYPPCFRE